MWGEVVCMCSLSVSVTYVTYVTYTQAHTPSHITATTHTYVDIDLRPRLVTMHPVRSNRYIPEGHTLQSAYVFGGI